MIVCTRCGQQNLDDAAFCLRCAGFLEWSGQRLAPVEVVAPEMAEEQTEDAVRRSWIRAHWEAIRAEPGPSGPAPDPGAGDLQRGTSPTDISASGTSPGVGAMGTTDAQPPMSHLPSPTPSASASSVPPPALMPSALMPSAPAPASAMELAPLTPAVAPPPGWPVASAAAGLPAGAPTGASTGVELMVNGVPAAVKPAPTRPRGIARTSIHTERVIVPGDLVCGRCGEGNDPSRYFCRRCGLALAGAPTYQLSRFDAWRLRRRQHRAARRVLLAGERPKLRRGLVGGEGGGWLTSGVAKVLGGAIVVLAILSLVGPFAPGIQSQIKQWKKDISQAVNPTYNPVHPVVATATSEAPGHPASLAIDGLDNTYWATGPSGSGVGQTLTVAFAQPVNIDRVGLLIGASGTPQAYLGQPRPQLVHLAFSDGTSKDVSLKDSGAFQAFAVKAHNVTIMQLTISAIYASPLGQNCAITEVELFSRA